MLWASNNGRKDGSGSIITGETGLAHTGTVVDHEGLDFFIVIAHIVLVFWFVGVFDGLLSEITSKNLFHVSMRKRGATKILVLNGSDFFAIL